jgi:predicted DNA binding CopG/RHH family protein
LIREKYTSRLNIKVAPSMLDALKKMAATEGRDYSEIIREMIRLKLKEKH